MYGLTQRQSDVLDYLQSRKGNVSPSYDEIMTACDFKSKSEVARIVNALKERGYIESLPGKSRSIKVIK